jgi:hypothetical protein
VEVLNKILDILKGLFPFVIGYLGAKQDSKIDDLKEENETLKEYNKIDDSTISTNDAYDGMSR